MVTRDYYNFSTLGGKFIDGVKGAAAGMAIGAAIKNIFPQDTVATVGQGSDSETAGNRDALQADLDALKEDGTLSRSHSFGSADEAAKSVLDVVAPLSREHGLEVAGSIFKGSGGKYHYTMPQIGGAASAELSTNWIGYHTHPDGSTIFSNQFRNAGSGNDAAWVGRSGKSLYVGGQRSNGSVGISVCRPGSCPDYGREGTVGSVIR